MIVKTFLGIVDLSKFASAMVIPSDEIVVIKCETVDREIREWALLNPDYYPLDDICDAVCVLRGRLQSFYLREESFVDLSEI